MLCAAGWIQGCIRSANEAYRYSHRFDVGDRTRLDRTSCPGPSMMMPNGFARWRIPGEAGS
jgi:hypothetical protein